MGIVLASGSPRRRELLENAGVEFRVEVSPAEEIHDESMLPEALCEANAELKAAAVAVGCPEEIVIGADTLVFIDDRALGKPKTMDEAKEMLRSLSGRTHRVCSGVCVIFPGDRRELFHGLTEVEFKDFDKSVIDEYFSKVNPLDKAGAYGIQEFGDLLVAGLRGSFDNVMGLPVDLVLQRLGLEKHGGLADGKRMEDDSRHGGAAPLSADI
jgi:septum formation protein